MQIRYFANIRELTRENSRAWPEPAPTLRELLRALSAHYGPAFGRAVMDGDDLSKTIIVLINGYDSRHQGGIAAPLRPDDTVSIFPMVAGGAGRLVDW